MSGSPSSRVRVVLCTCPLDQADRIASTLVEERLVACVNVVERVTSVYRWEGAVQRDQEALLVLKTADERFGAMRRRLTELHPYDVPEILALGVADGAEAYSEWVLASTRPEE